MKLKLLLEAEVIIRSVLIQSAFCIRCGNSQSRAELSAVCLAFGT